MVERWAMPSLLVDEDFRLVHASEHAGRYLQVPGGEPSNNVFNLVRKELSLELRAALQSANERGEALHSAPMELTLDGRPRQVVIQVRPPAYASAEASDQDLAGLSLVVFDETAAGETAAQRRPPVPADAYELDRINQRLHRVIAQYDASREEMRLSNEELQSVNEELRSERGEWFLTRVLPYRAKASAIGGFVVTLVDITQLKQAQLGLHDSEERFRALVTASAQIVWTADADGRMVGDSESWRGFTGQTQAQWKDQRWIDAIHPDDRDGLARALAAQSRHRDAPGMRVAPAPLRRQLALDTGAGGATARRAGAGARLGRDAYRHHHPQARGRTAARR
jgi:PAS domain-containing protein